MRQFFFKENPISKFSHLLLNLRKISIHLWCLLFLLQLAHAQEILREEVSVNWCVVPLFVIDQGENPVQDMTNADVWLRVDGQSITDFQIIRQNFTGAAAVAESQPAPVIKKVAFFIFDLALSSLKAVANAKIIARDILQKADRETQFGLVVIDPVRGLELISEPLADRKALLDMLDKKVNAKYDSAPYSRRQYMSDITDEIAESGKLEGNEIEFFIDELGKAYIPKINNFFQAFESFYYMVMGIREKKLFYLFSEGITNDAMKLNAEGVFFKKIKETAEFLNRAGGVVFIMNPAGTQKFTSDPASGDESLQMMADESGGKYLKGASRRIAEKIMNFDRAYYEIAFAAPKSKQAALHLRIEIKPKRRGLEIFSPSMLALPKPLVDKNVYEVEVFIQQCLRGTLALNSGYALYHESILFRDILDEGGSDEVEVIGLRIPPAMRNRELDVCWLWYDSVGRAVRMFKGKVNTGNEFQKLGLPVETKATTESFELKLVILDIKGNAALICDDAIAIN